MTSLTKENKVFLEALISIFTIDKGEVKVLLIRKKTEPYKGYWVLPGEYILNSETIEDCITDAVYDKTGLLNIYIEQCFTCSAIDRDPDDRVIATNFLGLVDAKSAEIMREERNHETQWFSINNVPKLGFDHEEIIEKTVIYLQKKIINSNVLKSLFPSDFTLPELQRVYEQILGIELDRRNFRKKFISLDLIEDTEVKNTGSNGRPAKLYKFKETIKERNLF